MHSRPVFIALNAACRDQDILFFSHTPMQNTIKLKVEGKTIEVDSRIASMSDTIKDLSAFAPEGTEVISLNNSDSYQRRQ